MVHCKKGLFYENCTDNQEASTTYCFKWINSHKLQEKTEKFMEFTGILTLKNSGLYWRPDYQYNRHTIIRIFFYKIRPINDPDSNGVLDIFHFVSSYALLAMRIKICKLNPIPCFYDRKKLGRWQFLTQWSNESSDMNVNEIS